MRFLSFLAISAIAFCMAMCTPNPANNVTPAATATGTCYDGIQNGSEQGVDCGTTGCTYACNGSFTCTYRGTTYKTGAISSVQIQNGALLSINSAVFYTGSTSNIKTLSIGLWIPSTTNFATLVGSYNHVEPNATQLRNKFQVSSSGFNVITNKTTARVNATGVFTISSVDTVNKLISGSFTYTGVFTDTTFNANDTVVYTGTFTNLKYNY